VAPQADWPNVTWSLVVPRPLASDALDSERVAVRPQSATLQVYKGALWSDSAPDLLQAALVHAFEDSGKIVSVGREQGGTRGDFALQIDMRQFEAVYAAPGQAPSVVVALQAKLISRPGNRVLALKAFHVQVPASSEKVPDVMASFDSAITQSLSEIVGWTLVTGQANAPPAAPIH
jgi:cholesterol transport system auxiliary component